MRVSNWSRAGLIAGAILALPPLLTSGMGALLALRVTEGELKASIQQAIGDTSLLVANHFWEAFQRLIDEAQKEGEAQLFSLRSQNTANPLGQMGTHFETNIISIKPEFLDISIWRRGKGVSVFDHDSAPQRIFVGLNNTFPGFSMDRAKVIEQLESTEKELVNPAFLGRAEVLLAPGTLGAQKFAMLVVPLAGENGVVNEVVVAHLPFSAIRASLPKNGMVSVTLLDEFGNVLLREARDENTTTQPAGLEFLGKLARTSKMASGQLDFTESQSGLKFFGGFVRLGIGQAAVISSVSEKEGLAAIHVLKNQLLGLWLSSFVVFFFIGYKNSDYINLDKNINKQHENGQKETSSPEILPQKVTVTSIYGSMRNFEKVFESVSAEKMTDTVNDYLVTVANCAKEYGGAFEGSRGGQDFAISWGYPNSDGSEVWRSVRCALQLRQEFKNLNEMRKATGENALSVCMGVTTGKALASRIGFPSQLSFSIVGEGIFSARALALVAAQSGKDLLVSQEIWSQSDAKFPGELVGETRLSKETELTPYYSISGYRNEQGAEVEVTPPLIEMENTGGAEEYVQNIQKESRWLVNNGFQIVGPFTPEEVAARLFAQELDVDCECWAEGVGTSAQIKTSGMFSGSEDEDATLWLYDGMLAHGPVSPGFLKTAIGHGAMPKTVMICEKSTVNGWMTLETWEQIYLSVQNRVAPLKRVA
jgi:class 3 adenylate cyclase